MVITAAFYPDPSSIVSTMHMISLHLGLILTAMIHITMSEIACTPGANYCGLYLIDILDCRTCLGQLAHCSDIPIAPTVTMVVTMLPPVSSVVSVVRLPTIPMPGVVTAVTSTTTTDPAPKVVTATTTQVLCQGSASRPNDVAMGCLENVLALLLGIVSVVLG
ncbi:hypothetical protein BDU57DRAFT_525359 [Ampelomyces quisqualis]|uniref:Uncharacterized protein n=1 Tax=Ampelomyces quisqualis TaxID=50730 RepID=A0A6A5QZI8_AMPQU|nr:hypothetical protein BDU57DRAFT_525359 [Ampelomyces quisqualis]